MKIKPLTQLREKISKALSGQTNLSKSFRSFFIEAMKLFLTIPNRINFLQMGRFGRSSEQRFRMNFRKMFNWISFNRTLVLDAKFPGVRKNYDILFTYNENDVVTSMIWLKNAEVDETTRRMHGKYLLQTSLDEKEEENIWEFYNVIRTVEETFKTLKSGLDIRPVFHKTDNATKAHLNLAVLACWVVSTTKYRLKQKGINARWDELLRIMSTQQRVTMVAEQTNGHLMKVRRSTTPETRLTEIQSALGITALPVCSIKSVWLREQPPEKDPPSKSGG